ncbi:uncharacterized protein EKO05_0001172 [Ascochyta rabiei]|uniref:Uncharacterized protein n=1 Tax=Didymella rabiei TaxID=5454 RepID=A0A162WHQ0_DIDRA|nr:uncharacterized protein EKO05_0001172 [Ascochyta rabiei]KZM19033.1 hypothetical protein ST47_g9822 [Ascochyta rabiei]UPX10517.1 hypothetical protein EKO05_0001172 [Ascochyta rabiei]
MSGKNEQGKMDVTQKNVFNAPLHQHSSTSNTHVTGYSSGMCSSEMPLALSLTSSFLDWSQQQGTDLRKSGIKEGARLCAYVNTWKAALDGGIDNVPKVKLEATHHHALDLVSMDVLKKYAAEQDNRRAESRVVLPKEGKQSIARESKEIGGKEPRA